jgi:voltage-gated potassium channel
MKREVSGMKVAYERAHATIYSLIRDDGENDFAASIFDGIIISLIAVNVLLVILDTFNGFPAWVLTMFRRCETVSVIVFTLEYAARLWTSDYMRPTMPPFVARLRYVVSFMALVDLLAILPFYLPFIFHVDMRVLRMIRLLRLLRILKANRYTSALAVIGEVVKRKASQLVSAMVVVIFLMVIASVLMYNVECLAQPSVFENAFSSLWWCVATLTTVGYGDIYPITPVGKVLSGVIALLGIGLVAIPTGVISAGFVEETNAVKDDGEKQYCPYCGKKIV